MERRTFLTTSLGVAAAAQTGSAQSTPAPPAGIDLKLGWLDGISPAVTRGVSWGVPWPQGKFPKDQQFRLNAGAREIPVQSWTLASWPDGSVKWCGFAAVTDGKGDLSLQPGQPAVRGSLSVKEDVTGIAIDTGTLQCRIPRSGARFIQTMKVAGREVARSGRLVATREDRSERGLIRLEEFESRIVKSSVENAGPVRAAVKVEGLHKSLSGSREWLPFTVRLYFYSGQESVRMVHSLIFDGDEHKDFISALGVRFEIPLREQAHNRHVRFSTEGEGLWSEPLQPLTGRRVLENRPEIYMNQLAGKTIAAKETFSARGQALIRDWAVWSSYKLVQSSADGFTIHKRTNPQSCWLEAGAGRRSSGYLFAGDTSGGLGVALKNFWQSYPAALEVSGAAQATADSPAEMTVWLWSPDAPAMDLRHYDTVAHGLEASYEDVQPGFSTPNGIGRTSELMLYPGAGVPEKQESVKQAGEASQPAVLACSPQHLHDTRAFGLWSLPDRSTPGKKFIEDQLDLAFATYRKEVEQRHWYGFWNYGDVMHSYDSPRHVWRYDLGGMAWDNSELVPDMWLWYSFLRTGRGDIFRMAEAMTRHTGEVDTYHTGRFAHLGSRHNVRHWGCGAKEVRISQAALRRFYYYLTTDERTGDIMHEMADADYKLTEIDPMRLALPPNAEAAKYPARARGGPDWLAFVGNWMTEWERFGITKYRDKIVAGMDSIVAFPYGFLSGPDMTYGYDPATGKLYTLAADPFGAYNLSTIMGGAEVVFELNPVIRHAGWEKAWLQFCRLLGASKEVVKRDMVTGTEDGGARAGGGHARLSAYAYYVTKDPKHADRAWNTLFSGARAIRPMRAVTGPDVPYPIEEVPDLSTNSVSQWALNAIEVLEMCGDRMPANHPLWSAR